MLSWRMTIRLLLHYDFQRKNKEEEKLKSFNNQFGIDVTNVTQEQQPPADAQISIQLLTCAADFCFRKDLIRFPVIKSEIDLRAESPAHYLCVCDPASLHARIYAHPHEAVADGTRVILGRMYTYYACESSNIKCRDTHTHTQTHTSITRHNESLAVLERVCTVPTYSSFINIYNAGLLWQLYI